MDRKPCKPHRHAVVRPVFFEPICFVKDFLT
jgi:hypothetical protein